MPVAGGRIGGFCFWGPLEPEFGRSGAGDHRGSGGSAGVWSARLSFRGDQILQCMGADESPLAFL